MTHSHKTKEEQTLCAVWFGECWQIPDNGASNQPHGTPADDN